MASFNDSLDDYETHVGAYNDVGIDFENYDFGTLDPVALDMTISQVNDASPGQMEGGYTSMLDDALVGRDWLDVALEAEAEERRGFEMGGLEGKEEEGGVGDGLGVEASESSSCSHHAGNTETKRRIKMQCTWDSCQWSRASCENFEDHMARHYEECSSSWVRGCRCPWAGCRSKSTFITVKLYNRHLTNIHTAPLLCTKKGCQYKKPFRDQNDLERHIRTQHDIERPYECPYDSCEASPRTFARKDKWLQHIRETQHQDDAYCPFPHCRANQVSKQAPFTRRAEISNHMLSFHGAKASEGFLCRIGSCGGAIVDNWNIFGLERHLINDHGGSYWFAALVTDHSRPHHTLTEEILASSLATFTVPQQEEWHATYHDCKVCASV